MSSSNIVVFVLPSLRTSGGVIETVRLAQDLMSHGIDVRILSLWKHPRPSQQFYAPSKPGVPIIYLSELPPRKSRAIFDLIFFMLKYRNYMNSLLRESHNKIPTVILTHYSTLLFACFTPASQRYCFLQGEEWLFAANSVLRHVFSRFVLFAYAHCRVITAHAYLTKRLQSVGLTPIAEAPVWADACFNSPSLNANRPIDFVMVLRQSHVKRLDLYLQLITATKKSIDISCAVITPEDKIAARVSESVDICLLRPSREEMRTLYQRSKVFVLLSEREGFGLPSLEAMGSGCVPFCRDSGGVRCYMVGGLAQNLIPLDAPLAVIQERLYALLSDREKLQELSQEARQIFLNGAGESRQKRELALALLSST